MHDTLRLGQRHARINGNPPRRFGKWTKEEKGYWLFNKSRIMLPERSSAHTMSKFGQNLIG